MTKQQSFIAQDIYSENTIFTIYSTSGRTAVSFYIAPRMRIFKRKKKNNILEIWKPNAGGRTMKKMGSGAQPFRGPIPGVD